MKKKEKKKKRKETKRKGTAQIGTRALRCTGRKLYHFIGYVEHTCHSMEFLLLKPLSLIKHEFKDIFQKNDCSLDNENPT